MMNPAEYQVEQIQFFFLMFARITAMIIVFPIFGSRNVPWQLKMGLSFFLSLVLFPLVEPKVVEIPNDLLPYAVLIIKEALVGMVIGFVASLMFTAVAMAGTIVDHQIGFSIARSIDPITESGASVIGRFKVVLFTIIFLALQGHQFLVIALVKSFEKIPVLGIHFQSGRLAEVMGHFITNIFDLALRLASPIMIIVLLTSVASGILSRTVPQMNMFVINLPVKVSVGIVGLAISLPIIFFVFEKAYHHLQDNILKLLFLMV